MNSDIDLNNVESFADFAESRPLEGDKVKIANILNKEIIVTNYRVQNSKQKKDTKCVTIQFVYPGFDEPYVVFTGSTVLQRQLEEYEHKLPFRAIVKQISNYYTFT